MDFIVASFVTPDKLQLHLDSRYRRFKTDLGYVFIKPDLAVSNDTVTLDLKKMFFIADITVDGLFVPGMMLSLSPRLVGEEKRSGRISSRDFLSAGFN
jgi:hypothetical protein